ncbi:flocculation protein FLO11-like [Pyrus ussuriensis x Pyrus communis]|uniref:Flocculation protein FLO11-like n=1 Tax=Pyrus ussuriensis x Pyrus communis TaxID=2448454 RepID=A0A5N5HBM8_9ROSA|nr:flocculation protein FLO11-like [Pyrus ussuriensis x Pyrus communis]
MRSKSAPLIRKEANYTREDNREDRKIDMKGEHSTSITSQRSWYLISYSSWRFRTKKSAAKTVPIDTSGTTVTDKGERPSKVVKFSSLQTKSKSKSGNLVSNSEEVLPATTDGEPPGTPSREEAEPPPIVSDPQTPMNHNPPQTNTINLESRKHLESPKDGMCQKRFCRKIDLLRTRTTIAGRKGPPSSQSQPDSPAGQEARTPTSCTRTVLHSMSFPARESQTQQGAPVTPSVTHNFSKQYSSWSWSTTVSNNPGSKNNNRGKAKAKGESTAVNGKNLDPLIGMSIILVTLIIMLVWGRLCAILSTSAWFYFLPRLRSAAAATTTAADGFGYPHHNSSSNVNTPRALDMNSEEGKKRVVLEGFLERNHRNIIP